MSSSLDESKNSATTKSKNSATNNIIIKIGAKKQEGKPNSNGWVGDMVMHPTIQVQVLFN